MKKGFSMIESLVGTALMLLVFVSIFGVFNMGIKLVGTTKAKAGAIALATEQMEMMRNFSYKDVGTVGGVVPGLAPQTETITLNGVTYTRRVDVRYVDDPKDGKGAADENGIEADYKVVRVELSWPRTSNPIVLVSNIVQKGIETLDGGGTLKINVFDASALPVVSAKVHIENSNTDPVISTDVFTNTKGKIVFPGIATSSGYEITVSKDGYSSSQTYSADAVNVTPDPGHFTILEGQTTSASFVIDKTSSKIVRTFEPTGEVTWYDYFDDWSKVGNSASTTAVGGSAVLEEEFSESYWSSGYLTSLDIAGGAYLVNWNEFSWDDNKPASTTIKYKVMYYQDSSLVAVPDVDLSGNEAGFENSPVDLSGLSTTTYQTLRLRADLETENASNTPKILDWQITWDSGPTPLPNIAFNMQGQKTIGKDSLDNPIYKYSENLATDSGGQSEITNLEFDVYNITIDGTGTGYDISESCPFQPANISPDTTNTTDLLLVAHANNTLLIGIKDADGNMMSGASARVYKNGYDETKISSSCGQAFFTPLTGVTYSIDVSKNGYQDFTSTVDVSGQTTLEVVINEL